MAGLGRAMASLRVAGEDLAPEAVTAMLGATPSVAHARGDEISSHGHTRAAKFGLWSYHSSDTQPANIDAQVAELLNALTPNLEVWRQLAQQFKLDLFCGWFMEHLNEGLEISPDTLTALAERHIALGLDIYGVMNRDDDD